MLKPAMDQAIPEDIAWMQYDALYRGKRAAAKYGHVQLPRNLGNPASLMKDRRANNDRRWKQHCKRFLEVRLGRCYSEIRLKYTPARGPAGCTRSRCFQRRKYSPASCVLQ